MGKRKERRLASQSNASRRIKLDLSADAPGDSGGSSVVVEELREGFNSKQSKSPVFTDQSPQNPLELLGQYSDDEEEQIDEHARSSSEESPQKTEEESIAEKNVTGEKMERSKSSEEDLLLLQEMASAHSGLVERDGGSDSASNACKEMEGLRNKTEGYANVEGTQWIMVLHEESNKYYYWNTETGETSWEIPPALGSNPTTSTTIEENEIENGHLYGVRSFDKGDQMKSHGDRTADCNAAEAFVPQQFIVSDEEKQPPDFPSSLLCQCENLLEKLKPLKSQLTDDWTSTILTELQVRHSDMNSLISYGSSVLPFWVLTEKQLRKIEDTVNKRIYDLAVSEQIENDDEQLDANTNSHSLCNSGLDKEENLQSQSILSPTNEARDSKLEEDVDMEVDMEVEETDYKEDGWVPPPPEDERIPPPPPSEECAPPPPSDDQYPSHLLYENAYVNIADPSYQSYQSVYPSIYYSATGQPFVDTSTLISAANIAFYNTVSFGDALLPSEGASSSYPSALTTDSFSSSDNSSLVAIERPATSKSEGVPSVMEDPACRASAKVTTASNKVVRSKKRTVAVVPSVRLNKKVSSLVDKWKAAREELYGDEEEPENAYELLERKRQREIEEWKAKQIASGEANDNANFQPLGCDWRERLKRKKTDGLIAVEK